MSITPFTPDASKEKDMTEVWESTHERSRKAFSSVLQSLSVAGKQASIAAAMGVSDSTVSRIKTQDLEGCIQFLYHAGFKLVPEDHRSIPEVTARAWFESHRREVERMQETGHIWVDE